MVDECRAVGCGDCGETDTLVLEFDHVGSKSGVVSEMIGAGTSVKRIRTEINECQVVCVNCHRRRTYRRSADSWRFEPGILEASVSLARGERRNLIFIRDLLLASACADCGVADLAVLEFDHLRAKTGNVVAMARGGCSMERLRAEIDKCQIRCGNCHRRRTVTAIRTARAEARKLAGPP